MNFIIKDRMIDTENKERLISYNKDYIARFTFDDEWDNTIKTARFIQDDQHTDVVLSDDLCEMPALKNGLVKIGVFNKTMTSTYVLLKVSKSIKDESGNPAEPEPDVYAQLISLIQSGMLKGEAGYTPVKGVDYFTPSEVDAIIGRADKFSQEAEKSAEAAAISERNAALSEQEAKKSAEQSAESASAADTSKRSAEEAAKAAKDSEEKAAASEKAAEKSKSDAATSAKSAADSALAAEKSKNDAQTLVDNFGNAVEEATTGAVKTVNNTKDNAVNTVNALLDTIPEDYTAMAEDIDCLKSDLINVNNNKADKTALASTNRRVDAMYKITEGQSWQEETVDAESYSNDVPSGSVLAKLKKIGGKSIVWNQLCNYLTASSKGELSRYGITVVNNRDGSFTVSGTATSNISYVFASDIKLVANHKYYIKRKVDSYSGAVFRLYDGTSILSVSFKNIIYECTANATCSLYLFWYADTYVTGTIHPMIIDLTQMFGAGNEPTIEEFEAMFPDEYYPYCEPTIISSQTDRVDVRGKNLLNPNLLVGEQFELVDGVLKSKKIINNGTSYIVDFPSGSSVSCEFKCPIGANYRFMFIYEDGTTVDKAGISTGDWVVMPTVTFSKRVVGMNFDYSGVSNDVSIRNIQIEKGSIATEYKPYRLQQIETGLPELNSAGSVYDYVDLSKAYESNGKHYAPMHQRIGKVVFDGSETYWDKNAVTTYYRLSHNNIGAKISGAILCDLFEAGELVVERMIVNNGDSYINFSMPTVGTTEDWKRWLAQNNTTLYYELAEEIVTDIEIPAELADCIVVEGGGSVTFHNTDDGKRLLIPNTTTYVEKLSEVTNG